MWIGILSGAAAAIALVVSFVALRSSRDAVRRVKRLEEAPRVDDEPLSTRNGRTLTVGELNGELTLLVTIPVRGADPQRIARLEALRHRHGSNTLDVVAIPVGYERRMDPHPGRTAGSLPVLAATPRHPFAETLDGQFGNVDAAYSKLLVDGRGRVIARFGPSTDPRSAEVSRAIDAAVRAN